MVNDDDILDDKMPFTEHLEELRHRLIICFIAVGAGFVVSYFFSKQLFHLLMLPLLQALPPGQGLIFTALPEAFFTYLKVSLLAGIGLASPVIIYQFWRFVAPGLYRRERRLLLPVVVLSTVFFLGGALFGYFVVFPYGFSFFINFAGEDIQAMPRVREYLSFAAKLLLAFGLIFELPLVTFFLARLGLVNAPLLRQKQKYAVLLIFVVAAILTPPDVVTQVMMAGPLILLYELSIWIARLFGKKPAAMEDDQTTAGKEPAG